MITDPVTLPPTALLHEAEELMHRFKFSGVPITDADGRLVGILTNRDIRFCEGADFDRPVTEFMTAERAASPRRSARRSTRPRRSCSATASRSCRSSTTTAASPG